MATPISVLFVCLGNHCRSPAAHAVAEFYGASTPYVDFDSAGTSRAHVGDSPHPMSVAEGRVRGFSVTHRGRQVSPDDFARFDLMIAMDDDNVHALERMRGHVDPRREAIRRLEPQQIQLLRRWDPLADVGDDQLADPWGLGRAAYTEMYDTIERCITPLLDHLASLSQQLVPLD